MYGYGYRFSEVKLPAIDPVKEDATISEPKKVDLARRPVVQTSLGCHVSGFAMPSPCPHDPDTMVAGVLKRFLTKPPTADNDMLEALSLFVDDWLATNLVPLAPDTDLSVETWLSKTNYPEWRRKDLLEQWRACRDIYDPKFESCSCFQKRETYPAYKHARAINARHDVFKCRFGPIAKAIEEVVYTHPSFIKHVPVRDRPEYIKNMLYRDGAKYYATDYTSFEAQFTKDIMSSVEMKLYSYMCQHLPQSHEMELIGEVLTGRNVCKFKNFVVEVDATRMSGEMVTSLGNGFSNLMFMLFMCKWKGCTGVSGVVEGDDGLFAITGSAPTKEDFSALGLNIKMETHHSLSTASFCGIIFDDVDMANVTSPLDELVNFGWTCGRYERSKQSKLKSLLRCKALSLAYQYPGCPILQSLAQYGLRVTRSHDIRKVLAGRSFNQWERDQLVSMLKDERGVPFKPVGMRTRLLVEERYGIPVSVQLSIEQSLDAMTELQVLDFPILSSICPRDWSHYWDTYCRPMSPKSVDLEYPGSLAPKVFDTPWEVASAE